MYKRQVLLSDSPGFAGQRYLQHLPALCGRSQLCAASSLHRLAGKAVDRFPFPSLQLVDDAGDEAILGPAVSSLLPPQ